jgi:large subunit ribosomal protein L9
MKVILLKDVAKIGRRFEVVDVSDGFALNKLIPKKMAEFATTENLKRINVVASKQKEHKAHDVEVFQQLLATLQTTTIAVTVEANSEGRMFQSLKSETIIEAIKQATGVSLEQECVHMKQSIKTVGEHTVELVSGKEQGVIQIIVTAKSK